MQLTPEELKKRITQIVRENASIQKSPENKENYFNSCIKHDGIIKEVAEEIKKEFI